VKEKNRTIENEIELKKVTVEELKTKIEATKLGIQI
jgi:hypothetical protein